MRINKGFAGMIVFVVGAIFVAFQMFLGLLYDSFLYLYESFQELGSMIFESFS